ncbi:hypothetical protein [Carnobacterium maltaromaticum]|uniref:hypothetical protein n=1 Tax=Carnobacterium maltaromaticum TaxID=2751 RepID=UPI00295ECEDC|nr:hypothetical protein [Carnobacterium maltaromaticum]
MAKTINYYTTYEINSLMSFRIKNKKEIISLILECCSIILTGYEIKNNGLGSFELHIDKMSRLFFYCENVKKFFSFSFPFQVMQNEDSTYSIFATNNKIELEPYMISILSCLNEDGWFDEYVEDNDMYLKIEFLEELCVQYGSSYKELGNNILSIVSLLHLFEPGYIRCDLEDEDNFDENHPDKHPKNHVDINYSQSSTFKMGLTKVLSNEMFKTLMDIGTDCYFIN